MGKTMGFFRNLFQRKKKTEKTDEIKQEDKLVLKDGIYSTPEERAGFVQHCCDLINEAGRQRFEAKKENFVQRITCDAGGKGINTSRALAVNDIRNTAYVVLGEENAQAFEATIGRDGIDYLPLYTPGRMLTVGLKLRLKK
jgi:hypothetical protein